MDCQNQGWRKRLRSRDRMYELDEIESEIVNRLVSPRMCRHGNNYCVTCSVQAKINAKKAED